MSPSRLWFRGVATSMGVCFDLGAVFGGHPDVFLAVDRDVLYHRQPVGIPELRERLPVSQLLKVGFNLVPSGCALGNQIGDLGMSGFSLIEPGYQSIVAFLVLGLIEGNVGVLLDAMVASFFGVAVPGVTVSLEYP